MSVSAPDTALPTRPAVGTSVDPAPQGAGGRSALVARAVGILSVQRRCSPEEGLRLLTELAARTGRSVPDQADRLIRRYPRLHSVLTRLDGPADSRDQIEEGIGCACTPSCRPAGPVN